MRKRILMALLISSLMVSTLPISYAANFSSVVPPIYASNHDESSITPHADVIVYKYRLLNGKQQYRRWNETRGYWVDPYWIDL